MTSIMQYINDALAELHQVRWPTRQQAIRLSLIVIAFTASVAIAFSVIDYVLSMIVTFLLSLTY